MDELIAICGEIDAWKKKKAGGEANAKHNGIFYYGLGGDEE